MEEQELNIQASVWSGRLRTVVEDAEDEDDDHNDALGEPDTEYDDIPYEEDPREEEFNAISVWDELTEGMIRAGLISGAFLSNLSC